MPPNTKLDVMQTSRLFVLWSFFHLGFVVSFYELLRWLGVVDQSLLDIGYQWDAQWYWDIATEGYSYVENKQSNVAYYPLFALMWKISGLGPFGISIANWFVTLVSIYIISREVDIPLPEVLLFSSFPSMLFCMVPYSEGLFFLGGALLLVGLSKHKLTMLIPGVIIACMTRSIGVLLTLCFLLTYLLNVKQSWTLRKHLFYLLPMILALCTNWGVQLYLFDQVNVHFDYLEVQSNWKRELSFPAFPLVARPYPSSSWADYLALFVGVTSVIILCQTFHNIINKRKTLNEPVVFSLLYLAGVTCIVLLFSGKYVNGNTVLASLNRFVFATPYMLLFFKLVGSSITNNRQKKRRLVAFAFLTTWLAVTFGSNLQEIHLKWQVYILVSLLFPITHLYSLGQTKFALWLPLYFLQTLLQAYFLGLFIAESWIG